MNKWLWAAVIIIVLIIGVWLLSAKTAGAPSLATSTLSGIPQDNFGTYSYECDEHVAFTITPASDMKSAYIAPNGGAATYPPATLLQRTATSAPGVLMTGGGLSFYGRGELVSLSEGDQSLNCSPVTDPDNAAFDWGGQ